MDWACVRVPESSARVELIDQKLKRGWNDGWEEGRKERSLLVGRQRCFTLLMEVADCKIHIIYASTLQPDGMNPQFAYYAHL